MITEEEVKLKTPERFWGKIKFGKPNECWIWMAGKDKLGYGCYTADGNDHTKAYRFIYYSIFQNSNREFSVCHNCPNGDNPSCVNPNHLWLGTQSQNNKDMWKKGMGVLPPMHIGSECHLSKITEEIALEIKQRLASGETQQKIADSLGITRANVGYINQGKTWKHVSFDMVSPKRIRSNKLTEDEVRIIKMRLDVGESCISISKVFNVGTSTISAIKMQRNWNHITV